MKNEDKLAVKMKRNCLHCGHEWEEILTNEEILKTIYYEPIGICPNPTCQLPT